MGSISPPPPPPHQEKNIHIAVLECLRLPEKVARVRGQFGRVFQSWIENALKTYRGGGGGGGGGGDSSMKNNNHNINIEFSSWDVEHGHYPPSLDGIDALIITGSTASAYDTDPWILTLGEYIRDIYKNNPAIRLFGGCFGHQLLCHVLLGGGGGGTRVEKSPKGWEIGVHDVRLNDEFRSHFPGILSSSSSNENENDTSGIKTMSSQFLHADHVVIPSSSPSPSSPLQQSLPPNWIPIGGSDLCPVQGVFEPDRVLTFQGHPEFDEFLNGEAVAELGRKGTLGAGGERQTEEALRLVRRPGGDDSVLHGHILIDFLLRG